MQVQEVLRELSFGERVAEDESEQLSAYFVETDNWKRLRDGDIDVIYAPKGAGKSALYSLLIARTDQFFDKLTLLVPCENPRGAPVFKALATDPPINEAEFVSLWKLYFVCLIASTIKDYGITGVAATELQRQLQESGLITDPSSLSRMLRSVYEYVKRITRPAGYELAARFDPVSQLPEVSAKILLSEPSTSQLKRGYTSVDDLLRLSERCLHDSGYEVWLLLDRLDVAFSESVDLETTALRALFRAYLDFAAFRTIRMKVFLRTDIWRKIASAGFREASHITRHLTIEWTSGSLLNLIIRRALQNRVVCSHFAVSPSEVLATTEAQRAFFDRMFPAQVDIGPSKPSAFDWMLSRVRDGSKHSAPRELIHLLNSLRNEQIRAIELGELEPENGLLFNRAVFKKALLEVSRTRLEQTLYAEYPEIKDCVEKLRTEKTLHTPATLATIWRTSTTDTDATVRVLVDIGFFEQRGTKQEPTFWVPFLYRDALDMVQGAAD